MDLYVVVTEEVSGFKYICLVLIITITTQFLNNLSSDLEITIVKTDRFLRLKVLSIGINSQCSDDVQK